MANEGTASIEIIGDVRNFARDTLRKLNAALKSIRLEPIPVRVDVDKIRQEGQEAGEAFGESVVKGVDDQLRGDRGRLGRAGEGAGDAAGEGARRGFLGSFEKMDLKNALGKIMSGLGRALSSGASGISSAVVPAASMIGTTIVGAIIATVGATLGPALLGTVAAAITTVAGLGLGAGLLGLGAFALKDVKALQKGVKDLGETLKDVGRTAAKPLIKPFSTALSDLAETVRQLGPEFRSIFTGLAPVVRPLVDSLGRFLGEVVRGLQDSIPGITAAFTGLSRALPEVGRWLGDFFRTIFENRDLIDNTTEGLIKLVFGPLKLLGPLISGLNVAFGVYSNLLRMLAENDYIGQIWASLMTFVDGGSGALERIAQAWEPLRAAIVRVWDTLKEFAAEDDSKQLEAKFQAVVEAVKATWEPLKEFIGQVWEEVVLIVQRVWDEQFVPWWEGTAVPWLNEAIRSAFEMAWDAAIGVVTGRLDLMRASIWNRIGGLPGLVFNALNPLSGVVNRVFMAAVSAATQQLVRLVGSAIDWFRRIVSGAGQVLAGVRNAVVGAFAGAGSWLVSAGTNIINGLLSGIAAGFGRVRSLLGELTALLPFWKGPAETDKKILEESGRLVIQGFRAGMTQEFRAVQRSLTGLTGSLAGWTPAASAGVTNTTNLTGLTFNINVSGTSGQSAGRDAAEEIIRVLTQAQLVR